MSIQRSLHLLTDPDCLSSNAPESNPTCDPPQYKHPDISLSSTSENRFITTSTSSKRNMHLRIHCHKKTEHCRDNCIVGPILQANHPPTNEPDASANTAAVKPSITISTRHRHGRSTQTNKYARAKKQTKQPSFPHGGCTLFESKSRPEKPPVMQTSYACRPYRLTKTARKDNLKNSKASTKMTVEKENSL